MKTVLTKLDHLSSEMLQFEWLLTNGIGGFACGTISGVPMRKYHALLNAALQNPYGRTIMLNYAADSVVLPDDREVLLSGLKLRNSIIESISPKEFRLENGLPIWTFEIDGILIEKSLVLIHQQNTIHVSYKLKTDTQEVKIRWKPFFHCRRNEESVDQVYPNENYLVHAKDHQYEIISSDFPPIRLYNLSKTPFIIKNEKVEEVFYEIEAERGYTSVGSLSSPGFFITPLIPRERTTFIASTENWETIFALSPKEAWATENMRKKYILKDAGHKGKSSLIAKLILAADQFLIKPITRFQDMIRLQASGEEIRSVIAGYPWFTDWGRDTMISLEGLTLVTGRYREASAILHTFAHYIHDGLIPNMFPDGHNKGIYNTADATLWFFHAIDRYITITQDEDILEFLLPKLESIIEKHVHGTSFGIKMDSDGLLIQGYPEIQLTWMDAKVGNWVVTPRRGKAVEINALWYNALKLYEHWAKKSDELSRKCYDSFNEKFWYEEGKYLYDVIEGEGGDDSALRPNQLFAISLKHPVLKEEYWKEVLDSVHKDLYTPVGLRTLSPHHPEYKAQYDGDLMARDAAYHQGSVWPWLLGPYIDTWLKVYPKDFKTVHSILSELESHIHSNCLETIGEIFDASPPFRARGCFAQAWSVAEILRCFLRVNADSEGKKS